MRIAIGARDLENGTVEIMRRDTLEKRTENREGIVDVIEKELEDIQKNLYDKAIKLREERTFEVDTFEEFKSKIEDGGFFLVHWDGTPETEERIKEETKATIRCIPLDGKKEEGVCMVTGKLSSQRVLVARAY